MNRRTLSFVLTFVLYSHILYIYVKSAQPCRATLEANTALTIESSIIAIVSADCISDPNFNSILKIAEFAPTETSWNVFEWKNAFELLQNNLDSTRITDVIIHVLLQDKHNLVRNIKFNQLDAWSYGPVLEFGERSFVRMTQLDSLVISNMVVRFNSERWAVNLIQIEFRNVTMKKFEIAQDSLVEKITFQSSSLSKFPSAALSLSNLAEINILSVAFLRPLQLTSRQFNKLKSIDSVSLKNITAPTDETCVTIDYIQNVAICVTEPTSRKDDENNKIGPSFRQTSSDYKKLLSMIAISLMAIGLIISLYFLAMVLYQRKTRVEAIAASLRLDHVGPPALSTSDTYEAISDHRSKGLQSAIEVTTAHIRNFASNRMITSAELRQSHVVLQQKVGVWGLFRAEYQRTPVVILKLDCGLSEHWKSRRKTIKQLNQLSKIRHRFVTHYIGFYTSALGSLHLVVEAMEEGSLRTLLLRRFLNLSWRRRLLMCLDIAKALQFLHCTSSLKPKDRMLRSTSFLCSSRYTCKIDVFDCISGIRRSKVPFLALGEGNLAAYAPEILASERTTEASEIYMIGVVMCEISNQRVTFHDRIIEEGPTLTDCHSLQTAQNGLGLNASAEAPKEFQELITQCTASSPSDRPSITQIWNMLVVIE
ncbi:unnamed protein product [Albugo candida]|uniref:Protein kinase domain-containing protein n=1 Tax=Albugo candida TaxID=65357 RepID=A0A024GP34_9STRA|nr:unnamed protein product [Albugo candida]|eukprot:CCI48652.1 unnamed protein product [Albugo candida]